MHQGTPLQPQLPGGQFRPCDVWKKLSHPILLHFPFMWIPITYVHMYGWVSVPQRITFLKDLRFKLVVLLSKG